VDHIDGYLDLPGYLASWQASLQTSCSEDCEIRSSTQETKNGCAHFDL